MTDAWVRQEAFMQAVTWRWAGLRETEETKKIKTLPCLRAHIPRMRIKQALD